jgi:hypothetical protein
MRVREKQAFTTSVAGERTLVYFRVPPSIVTRQEKKFKAAENCYPSNFFILAATTYNCNQDIRHRRLSPLKENEAREKNVFLMLYLGTYLFFVA